jgi:spoIIIJ-associated protein
VTEDPKNQPSHRTCERSIQSIADFCQEFIAHLQMELAIDVKEEADTFHVNFAGPDRSYLLSNSASLLNCIEYLLNKIFRAGGKDDAPGIFVDSDSYRQHREAELVLLAQMASQKVISFRKPLSLQPMVPRERRIVHLALAEIEGVRTQSSGEGDNRSITIYPS